VFLTFDDGPDTEGTPAVLEVLARHSGRGTFFFLTEKARLEPELVRRTAVEGHAVGLHADRHERLDRLAIAPLRGRLRRAAADLEEMAGVPIPMHRPPFGRLSWRGLQAARGAGLSVVLWSRDPQDYEPQPPDLLQTRLRHSIGVGEIVLLHDGAGTGVETAAALDTVLASLGTGSPRLAALADPRRTH